MASFPKAPLPAELPLFRFRLRHLLAFFAVVSALLTELVAAQGVAGLILLVVTLVVMAHVTATSLGTRLRECSPSTSREELERRKRLMSGTRSADAADRPARSLLYGYDSSPLAKLPMQVVGGVSLGGIGGALFLAQTIGHRTSLVGLAVGAVSLAVLGGWFSFLGSSFYAMFRDGWREAVAGEQKSRAVEQQSGRTAEH
jgi:hypothetical protein